jgi:predicted permease
MEALSQDIRQAFRTLRKSPVFAATAVLTLALGIGANTAIFSVFNTVVLRPVSVPEPDTLVQLVSTVNGQPISTEASVATYSYWREQTDVIEDVAAYRGVSVNYTDGDTPMRVAASQVTASYFRAFRANMVLGRSFTADEDLAGGPKVAVSSYGFWTRQLGSDPDVIGKTLSLNGVSHTVVGVAAFEFGTLELGNIALWMPLAPSAVGSLEAVARLKPGVSLEQAQEGLAASTTAFRERVATSMRDEVRFGAVLFKDAVTATGFRNDPRGVLWLLIGAVTFVLLIACANVAGLMLTHTSAREREMAVRSALGAGRWRIVRQLLTESAVISGIGGVLGLTLGFIGIRALLAINTAGLPRVGQDGALVAMDWRVIAFTLSVSIATVVMSGLLPALAVSRGDRSDVIRYSRSPSTTGLRKNKARSAVVVVEISLAIVLLVGAALLIRTTVALNAIEPGFNVDEVITLRTSLPEGRFHSSVAIGELSGRTLERIRSIPNVEAAGASCCIPLQDSWGLVFKIIGRDDAGRPFTSGGDVTISTGDYFEVFQTPIVRGRVFNERDDSSAPPVLVINRALADRWWPNGQEPLGQRIQLGREDEPAREVIGVVENERKTRLEIVRPIMYVPQGQISDAWMKENLETDSLAWIVRTSGDPMRLSTVLRDQIQQSTGVPVTSVAAMKDVVANSISRQRANMLLMSIFGAVALLLTAIGVYGLVAYSVHQRTHEIGVRMALGARRNSILGMVIRHGVSLAAIGAAIGITAAYFLASLLASMLYGVEPRDAAVFIAVPITLAVVVLVAVSIPAYGASRLHPLHALRSE